MTRPLVIATGNRAKARELATLLHGLPYRIVDLNEVAAVTFPREGESSYRDNALGKARAVSAATGMVSLADDSGLEVDALGGRPGVLSARYGRDPHGSDADRCATLLVELRDVPAERRTARYRCVVALCAPSGREATCEGVVEGVILGEPRGGGGFGYDPVFYYQPLRATFAELNPETKNQLSHRGRAMAAARQVLLEWAGLEHHGA